MNLFDLEEEFLPKKVAGMSFSEIRKELAVRGVDEEGIRIIIGSIDNKILSGEYSKLSNRQGSELFWMGLVFLVGGIILSIGSYMGWIGMGNYFFVAYGPVLGGASLMGMSKVRSGRFKK